MKYRLEIKLVNGDRLYGQVCPEDDFDRPSVIELLKRWRDLDYLAIAQDSAGSELDTYINPSNVLWVRIQQIEDTVVMRPEPSDPLGKDWPYKLR